MTSRFETGRTLPPLILIVTGGYILTEAATMTPFGAIFPRLAGGGLVIGALVLLARVAAGQPETIPKPQKAGRALLLLAVLTAWSLLLTVIGFVPACLLGAVAASVLVEPRLPLARTLASRTAGLVATILVIASLFAFVLNVPLP